MPTLQDIVEKAAGFGARPALVDGATTLTYAHVTERAARLAEALRRQGVGAGDRVAMNARNSFRVIELNFACAILGAMLVPLNFRLAPNEIEAILKLTAPKLLFCATEVTARGAWMITWNDDDPMGADCPYEAFMAGAPAARPAKLKATADDAAQIFFTSGTSGTPKGAVLSHGALAASAQDAVETLGFTGADVWLHASPMFHLVDAFAIWGISKVGGRHVTVHFDPARFAGWVAEAKITKTSLPPTLLDWIAKDPDTARHDLSSLQLISYGGSPMQEAVYARCVEALGCRLTQAYGLTEGSGFVCHERLSDNSDPARAVNTVGRAVAHAEVALHDDDGAPVAMGAVGEFALRGARLFSGYWADPENTARAMRDGWYLTGDLGVQDAAGRYRVIGRKKEMIITGGENVYPSEILNVLLAHPGVAEAAVFGLPSEHWGEQVCAVIYPNRGDGAERVSDRALMAHCRAHIAAYKVPKLIHFWPEPLPKSGPGKVATSTIRSLCLRGKLP